jgi:hypothetical protein
MTEKRPRIDRLTPEQRAEVKARVSTWPKLTEAEREKIRVIFAGRFTQQT